LPEHAQPLLPR